MYRNIMPSYNAFIRAISLKTTCDRHGRHDHRSLPYTTAATPPYELSLLISTAPLEFYAPLMSLQGCSSQKWNFQSSLARVFEDRSSINFRADLALPFSSHDTPRCRQPCHTFPEQFGSRLVFATPEDSVTAIVQRAHVSATKQAFAVWCTGGGNRVVSWGDPRFGGDLVLHAFGRSLLVETPT